MQFIANYDAKNVFGCFENVEQHALAFSKETAVKLLDSGMRIFRGDASTLNALKLCFSGGETVCIYREIADIDNGVFRVRIWDRLNSYDEKTMSRQALKKKVLFKISQEFAEPAEQIA
jgi:hypothetical protein